MCFFVQRWLFHIREQTDLGLQEQFWEATSAGCQNSDLSSVNPHTGKWMSQASPSGQPAPFPLSLGKCRLQAASALCHGTSAGRPSAAAAHHRRLPAASRLPSARQGYHTSSYAPLSPMDGVGVQLGKRGMWPGKLCVPVIPAALAPWGCLKPKEGCCDSRWRSGWPHSQRKNLGAQPGPKAKLGICHWCVRLPTDPSRGTGPGRLPCV